MPARQQISSGIQSVGRAIEVLDLLADAAPEGVRVTDVADALDLSAATASRLLSTLASRGYASRRLDRSYTVGSASIRMATGWLDRRVPGLNHLLRRLSEETREASYLLQLLGSEAVVVGRMQPPQRSSHDAEIGTAFPVWATAGGQALISDLSAEERRRLLPSEPFPAFTDTTITSWQGLDRALASGKRTGVYAEDGHLETGLACLAAPLRRCEYGEHLAVAISFESRRTAGDQAGFHQILGSVARAMRSQMM